jgi:NAD(P)-dependent dehydrogenase (short-subunit alcohol dehydrogenase family)
MEQRRRPKSGRRAADAHGRRTLPVALITGGSRGLGLALARSLAPDGWSLVIDARGAEALESATRDLLTVAPGASVIAVAGDVADAGHRAALADAVHSLGGLDLLVNNASILGPSPLPPLGRYPLDELARVLDVNVSAPLALIQLFLADLKPRHGRILNVSSDAAVEGYAGWGGYGSSKAALDQLTRVLAVEHPDLRVYSVDPGDMRTEMHQQAFPGEDISDRPLPEESVPALRRLIDGDLPSGRYRASELLVGAQR